jgi:hypothetical protein
MRPLMISARSLLSGKREEISGCKGKKLPPAVSCEIGERPKALMIADL